MKQHFMYSMKVSLVLTVMPLIILFIYDLGFLKSFNIGYLFHCVVTWFAGTLIIYYFTKNNNKN